MSYLVKPVTLDQLDGLRGSSGRMLNWSSPFILPVWLKAWWNSFGSGNEMFIRTISENDTLIGIAPLMKQDGTACFLGGTDVCDYQDFIIAPSREKDFFRVLLEDMKKNGISAMELKHVRPDSMVMTCLAPFAEELGHAVSCVREEVSFEMDLPSAFDAWLESLNTKQRHEVRRKLRRLHEEGNIAFRFEEKGPGLDKALETFFRMFTQSRQDKAVFLTEQMKLYFKDIVAALSAENLLKLGVLELDNKPIAEIICFDYRDCVYLYNSGYDPQYVSLSAGLLSKVLAIKHSIEKGKKKFDFLKGAEPYKAHIGGREVPLSACRIALQ